MSPRPDAPSITTNWAGNVTFSYATLHRPTSIAEVQSIVASSTSCRVVGSGHSFSTVADTRGDLLTLAALPRTIEIDGDRRVVRVGGSIRYGELAIELQSHGWALHNLGSLPHISVAGACATGTHGSGDRNGCLATAVTAVELITATGELVTIDREAHPDSFDGAIVTLGTLGVVVSLTLRIEPTFTMRQTVFEAIPVDDALSRLDELFACAYSVSLFTRWQGDVVDQVWVKERLDDESTAANATRAWLAPHAAPVARHPVVEVGAESCNEQLGSVGPWHERLPHFRLDFTPSTGDELQTEYFVGRTDAIAALQSLRSLRATLAPALLICELRTIAADALWLSPAFGRDTLALHFTWIPDPATVAPVVAAVEERLAPFAPRPHWGKVFSMSPAVVATRYPRMADAATLAERFDPRGVFRNDFVDRYVRV